MPIPDHALYVRLQSDPEEGLSAIMDAYAGLVYTIVYGKLSSVGTKEDAEECIGDVFMEFRQTRAAIDPAKGSIRAYLTVIVHRKAVDAYRRLYARRRPLDEMPPEDHLDIAADDDVVADTIHREEIRALICAIHALGEPDCEIILRKYYCGESARSIGKSLHMKENTVNQRAARALAELRESLS